MKLKLKIILNPVLLKYPKKTPNEQNNENTRLTLAMSAASGRRDARGGVWPGWGAGRRRAWRPYFQNIIGNLSGLRNASRIDRKTRVWMTQVLYGKGGPHHPPRRVDATRLALQKFALSASSCRRDARGAVWPGVGGKHARGKNKKSEGARDRSSSSS